MSVLLLTALLFAGDTATTATAATGSTAHVEVKKERKICKRETVSTSLHGSKRVCLTAEQWRARERNATGEEMGASVGTRSN